jgi:hypothetical protein
VRISLDMEEDSDGSNNRGANTIAEAEGVDLGLGSGHDKATEM